MPFADGRVLGRETRFKSTETGAPADTENDSSVTLPLSRAGRQTLTHRAILLSTRRATRKVLCTEWVTPGLVDCLPVRTHRAIYNRRPDSGCSCGEIVSLYRIRVVFFQRKDSSCVDISNNRSCNRVGFCCVTTAVQTTASPTVV